MPIRPSKKNLGVQGEAERLAEWRKYCDALYEEGRALRPDQRGSVVINFQGGWPRNAEWRTIGDSPKWATGGS